MKRVFILLLFLFIIIPSFAQITVMKSVDEIMQSLKSSTPAHPPYDSLTNFKHQVNDGKKGDFSHLIGQTIMFCGDPLAYVPPKYSVGEYFTIEGILPDDVKGGLYDRLSIKRNKTGEIINLGGIGAGHKYNWQWVVQGHYEKLKQLYVGRDFIYEGPIGISNYSRDEDKFINVKTNKSTKDVEKGSIWTCVDVQVKPFTEYTTSYRSPLVLVFDNPSYGQHYCYYEDDIGEHIKSYPWDYSPLLCGYFYDKEQYESYLKQQAEEKAARKAEMIKKYGQNRGTMIAEGKVQIGMTKQMCLDSWGEPNDVNTTIVANKTHEQWVYGYDRYLYFDNGILTAIQQ